MNREFRIYRYYPSGNTVYCASFSNKERAISVMNEWKKQNPSAEYQIHEY